MAEGIAVRFGGFVALDGAGVRVGPGEVVGLIGPNGAGKTTLFNVITGLVAEDAGTVRLGDQDLSHEATHRIARAGLARSFQNLRLFPTLTVRENVALAALSAHRYRRHQPAVDADTLLGGPGWAASPSVGRRRWTTAASAASSWPAPPRWPRRSSCSTSRRRA